VDVKAKVPAKVSQAACAGCGTCAAECPSEAITMHHFTDGQIMAQVDAILEETPDQRVVVFACNWCSYAGADFAGVNRFQYPANSRLVRTMCSGRVSEKFVWHAFAKGAPVVLVSGCHIGDCHYINANHWTERRVKRMQRKMEKWGLRPERLQLEWISAAEGVRFRQVMERMEELRQGVSAQEIAQSKAVMAAELAKAKKRAESGAGPAEAAEA
jgi:heterodisulfide reductase subunit A